VGHGEIWQMDALHLIEGKGMEERSQTLLDLGFFVLTE
jgi:hypothetical protein